MKVCKSENIALSMHSIQYLTYRARNTKVTTTVHAQHARKSFSIATWMCLKLIISQAGTIAVGSESVPRTSMLLLAAITAGSVCARSIT